MKLALATEGTRGDIHPMLALADRLVARGHEAVLCAPPDFAETVARRGHAFQPVGCDIRRYIVAEAASIHGGPLAMAKAGQRLFHHNVERQFADLREAAEGCDGILAAGTQIAASSIAEHLGLPYRYVVYDPILLRSSHQPPVFCSRPEMPRWLNRFLWWGQLRMLAWGMGKEVNRERAQLGLAPVRDLYGMLLGRDPLIAAEERIAPAPPDAVDHTVIGCLHPFEGRALPEKLDAFLSDGEPPVYIGFGSMPDPDPQRSTSLLLDAIDQAGVRAVISAGWAGLGEAALPGHVQVVGSVDHSSLFPRTSAIVHHGGAGTTTTAARSGTPQVLVPHVLDQFHWAGRVQRLGVAPPPLERRKLTPHRLAQTLRAVVDNEWLSDNAAELGRQLRLELSRRADPVDVIA